MPIYAYLDLSGRIWAYLSFSELSGPIWAYLGLSGPIWAWPPKLDLNSQLASELPGLI